MLTNFALLRAWFPIDDDAEWDFDEITFDEETKNSFSSLKQYDRKIRFFGHSVKVMNNENNNHCYMPSQSFLYVLKLRPALILLNKYKRVYDELRSLESAGRRINQKQIIDILRNRSNGLAPLDALDLVSRTNFFDLLAPRETDDTGKKFINGDSLRSDGFDSAILKMLPVPDSNASELAKLLLGISTEENMEVLSLLERKYSHAIPWLFRAASADELMFRVMSTLGWEGKLDELQDAEPVSWCGITDALLTRPIPEPGNSRYVDTPVHYLTSCKKYVFVRKDLLDATTLDAISTKIAAFWPDMTIRLRDGMYYVESEKRSAITGGINCIFYGAPGTGKSHRVHHECNDDLNKFVTVFHPDTQHADFVGSLKPVTESGSVVYRFRAGPFTDALVHALMNPDRKVTLVIEEINRASAAAVFGELFQLLDRNPDGGSTYSIRAADPDMLGYINHVLEDKGFPSLDVLRIPANLSLLATMNSSDQAVMPLDTAFKRRWRFEYLPIDFSVAGIPQIAITLATTSGPVTLTWPALAKCINAALVECDVAEDRLLGPFFLSAKELESEETARSALGGKLFIYLWDDVLRHQGHDRIFSSVYKTYGALSAAFREGMPVFSPPIEEALAKAGVKADTAAESLAPDIEAVQDAAG
ncbi:AAA family ATPase [Aeromonas veronii]|uniref:AAA family ATPase n=1 Tax=Aeromonas veronii TaxID=654 RepID=UPI001F1F9E05|nr:AAA family ATPase [Aeromonas veronii]MCF5767658.1 AAA family ATPase [Aeromonas veronii]